jgi:UDP-N-acetylmuramate dehydrogenase
MKTGSFKIDSLPSIPIAKNVSLRPYNTFGIEATAGNFATFENIEQLKELLRQNKSQPLHILGGGSNILLTQPQIEGLVIRNLIKGIEIDSIFEKHVWVAIGAGELWHDLVQWCLEHQLGGIENLSLIPGTVGAAPMQNIGAYGVELKDVFIKLEAIHLTTGKRRIFYHRDCQFGYRESIFKTKLKNQYCITKVWLKLQKPPHQVKVQYGDIQKMLQEKGITKPGIRDISQTVIAIRQSKLPDPAILGNAGSFFKNPVIPLSHFTELKLTFPEMPSYPVDENSVKIPAGWLIEKTGWKGKVVGNTGSHARQALVLVNYGQATGTEIHALALRIIADVNATFGIILQPEVNLW